ncbi:MAG TPA: cyclic nucleotide-binding domain-containing protein [Candidatus Binataceae bacterium]|nr:cyclic nucleotide-binding domain-containing protein [Candidatus Binataceae bacterium]
MENLARLLKEHPFLHGLEERHLEFLTGCAANVRYGADEFLFKEGQESNASYLVRSGRIALEISVPGRGLTQLQTIEAGEVLGWSWLYPPYRWQFDARAVEPVRAFALDGNCLRTKCEADHDLGYEVVKRFLRQVHTRLERTRLQLLDIYN